MKLKDIMKPSAPLLDAKTYLAVIVGVFEVGEQYSEKYHNSSRKLIFAFDIPSVKDTDGRPRQLSKWLTPGKKKGCAFLEFFGGLDDKNYAAKDVEDIDPESYLGRACQVRVTVNTETQRNNIGGVMSLPDGIPVPQTDTPLLWYSVTESGFSGAKWDALPDWVRDACMKSEQYQATAPDQPLDMPEDCPI